MNDTLLATLCAVGGGLIGIVVVVVYRRAREHVAQQIAFDTEKTKADEISAVIEQLKTSFAALSREALSSNTDDFLKLAQTRLEHQTVQAEQTLENKKKLIDANLEQISQRLNNLGNFMQQLEKQRAEAHGTLTGQLDKATQATNRLHETTAQLREALANPQRRGQWGERMAEDVLRAAGLAEGLNYQKQTTVSGGTRPDFTFYLPDSRVVHMDVKFPLANYLKMLDATEDAARAAAQTQFLRDVRNRVKEVTSREYIDPAKGTVEYCLVFIPNEQVYGFIHECDSTLLDDALRQKVVLCSPLTLYAILVVIRQAVDNFRLEQASRGILQLLGEFKKQWARYVDGMDRMGDKLEGAMQEYQKLVSTRTRQLERQLDKIDDLQAAQGEASDDQPSLPE